ncbi:hypothetical protein KOR34_04830 [Posidoniimonas corsicana]|uniref:GYF domain-containing protein n=1 Tax=Posidoniimonas corsicana TaxID=1938618 RepID=A0A5C5VC62_9BACT|nr:DUF4339 domain-containing protein [Posidoniimonas corsicana]TWT35590.1 hypothetical protein KOR34_04830 [Posidoniimonas corsicana]
MDEQLYVRIRGRVQGPFELDRLRNLVRRGQLSRIHEVSTDQATWTAAGDYPELFASSGAGVTVSQDAGREEVAEASTSGGSPSTEVSATWYYSNGQSQQGPVTLPALKSMLQSGMVDSDELVWTEGMDQWVAANQVRELGSVTNAVSPNSSRQVRDRDPVSESTARTLAESRPWVLFISIFLYVTAALFIVGGILGLAVGPPELGVLRISASISLLLYGVVSFWAAQLLLNYTTRLGKFINSRSDAQLDSAFKGLKTFWVFTSFILIYLTVNAIAGIFWLTTLDAALKL